MFFKLTNKLYYRDTTGIVFLLLQRPLILAILVDPSLIPGGG